DNYNKRMFDLCLSGLQLTGPVLLVYQGFVQGGAKRAALNTETGGAMDDVRAMARSYSDAKGAAKELEMSSLGKRFGRQLRAMSSGIGGTKAELGVERGGVEAARRKWDGADNPLHEDKTKEATKEAVDQRHLIRAKSGGFHKKPILRFVPADPVAQVARKAREACPPATFEECCPPRATVRWFAKQLR
ncbi:hypothetical protein TeGR_g6683, partial [Tetraparma gracilis]